MKVVGSCTYIVCLKAGCTTENDGMELAPDAAATAPKKKTRQQNAFPAHEYTNGRKRRKKYCRLKVIRPFFSGSCRSASGIPAFKKKFRKIPGLLKLKKIKLGHEI